LSGFAANSAHHALRPDNITLPHGAGRSVGMGLMGIGLLAALAVLGMGLSGAAGITLKHALGVYLIGAMGTLAISLGALFYMLVFNLTNAGWTGVLRRQFENVASFLPFAYLLVLPVLIIEVVTHGTLFVWMRPEFYADHALQSKSAFFFAPLHIVDHETHTPVTHPVLPVFFLVRAAIYGAVWTFLSRRLCKLSRLQDTNPSPEISAKARFTSAWGMLIFALTLAFASFDWLMSLDFKFFSTMWPVWYFACSAFSGIAFLILVFARLKSLGRLDGVVTQEHFHDKGKLLFSFTVFWAYISFSQYFLIWYSNIPEETAYYYYRTAEWSNWRSLGIFLVIGHFVVPFVILLFRKVKQTPMLLGSLAVWALIVHFADIYYVVRPMVGAADAAPLPALSRIWVDLIAIGGVFAILVGYVALKVPRSALVAANDPWIGESLEHKNYV